MPITKYKPEYDEQAKKLCKLGAVDLDLADFFDIDIRTFYRWRARYPSFRQALKVGKKEPDDGVVRSLLQRAMGYSCPETRVFKVRDKDGNETLMGFDIIKHYPPDPTSCIFWLKNRLPAEWREKIEHSANADEFVEAMKAIAEKLPV